VLVADVAVLQRDRLTQCELEHLLGLLGEPRAATRLAFAWHVAQSAQDLLEVYADRRQRLGVLVT
jgi:hypothetical protein